MVGLLGLVLAFYFYPGPKRFISVWLLFFLATAGFQLLPLTWVLFPKAGISKPYDWVLVFTAALFFIQPKYLLQSPVWKQFKPIVYFLGLLIVLFGYSIFFRDIEVQVVVRVFRNFAIFIVLFHFVLLDLSEFRKVFQGIVYATTLASLVYCLQPLLHAEFLNKITADINESVAEDTSRFYNIPVFVYPVVFFLFYSKHAFSIRFRYLLLTINLLAILLTQHRNMLLAGGICFVIFLVLQNRITVRNALLYSIMAIAGFMAADAFLGQRLSKGIDNVSGLSLNTSAVRFSDVALSDLNTTRFRQLLVTERFRYVTASDTRAVLGIGLMTDDSRKAKSLNFYIGIPDDDGNISQIANVDIVWASLLLQLGIPGTLLFCWLHLWLMKKFYQRKVDNYLQVGILYLASLLITSLYGSMIAMPYTICLVMLFAAYHYRQTQEITVN